MMLRIGSLGADTFGGAKYRFSCTRGGLMNRLAGFSGFRGEALIPQKQVGFGYAVVIGWVSEQVSIHLR